jgi:hypothetical protein
VNPNDYLPCNFDELQNQSDVHGITAPPHSWQQGDIPTLDRCPLSAGIADIAQTSENVR